MPKAYWLSLRNEVHDQTATDEYRKLAGPAIAAGGGTFLARGGQLKSLEGFEQTRVVMIEFADMDTALACYHSDAYHAAHAHIANGEVTRDVCIAEGVEDLEPRGATAGPVAFWIGAHMEIHDQDKLAAYIEKTQAAMPDVGGRFLSWGGRTETLEGFHQSQVLLIELPNFRRAVYMPISVDYQSARFALDGGVTQDICIAEGLEGI